MAEGRCKRAKELDIDNCGPILAGEEYCLFHKSEKSEEEAREFYSRLEEQAVVKTDEDGRERRIFENLVDWRGYVFPSDEEGVSTFMDATFMGGASFKVATFVGEADFMGAVFVGAYFGGATFMGGAYFRDATFEDVTDFRDATFEGKADFMDATFESGASFKVATFESGADFMDATIVGEVDFMDATFEGGVSFRGATFLPFLEKKEQQLAGQVLMRQTQDRVLEKDEYLRNLLEGEVEERGRRWWERLKWWE